jgi:hypothetical protein
MVGRFDFSNSDRQSIRFTYNNRIYLLTKPMPVNELIDKVCELCSNQKKQILELKTENVELQKKIADAVLAVAADNTAHLAEAEAAATKLQAELTANADEEYAKEQAAVTAKLEALLVVPTSTDPPIAFEQVAQ